MSSPLLVFVAFGYLLCFTLPIAAIRANGANERLLRDRPSLSSWFWGFFLGDFNAITGVAALFFLVPFSAGSVLETRDPVPVIAAVWAAAMFGAGKLTRNRSRWGAVAATMLTAFPPAWILYAVYIAKRWTELADPMGSGDETEA